MFQRKFLLGGLLAGALLSGCAATPDDSAGMSGGAALADTYNSVTQAAVSALDKANSVGYEWRDSRKFLDQAKELATKGDYQDAIKLAEKAKQQGMMAYEQYQRYQDAQPHL